MQGGYLFRCQHCSFELSKSRETLQYYLLLKEEDQYFPIYHWHINLHSFINRKQQEGTDLSCQQCSSFFAIICSIRQRLNDKKKQNGQRRTCCDEKHEGESPGRCRQISFNPSKHIIVDKSSLPKRSVVMQPEPKSETHHYSCQSCRSLLFCTNIYFEQRNCEDEVAFEGKKKATSSRTNFEKQPSDWEQFLQKKLHSVLVLTESKP